MNTRSVSLPILFLFLLLHLIDSLDTLALNDTLRDGDVLISRGRKFALGFFSPGNSSLRYVGIWFYGLPERTVVWVANRGNPVNDTSGVVALGHYGNLVIHENRGGFPIWSTNVSSTTLNGSTTAQLLDSGNLVLNHDLSKVVIWQSFDYPTDTFLPSMKLGLDRRTGLNWFLTSWKSEDDPAPGSCSFRFEPTGYPQLFLYKDQAPYWRGGPIPERPQRGVPEAAYYLIFSNITIVNNAMEVSLMYGVTNASVIVRSVVHESGSVNHFTWHDEEQRWTEFAYYPKEQCDHYSNCGPNGNCGANSADQLDCTCLPGFEPKSPSDGYPWDGSGGCKRRQGASMCRSGEGFVKLKRVKLPDTSTAHVDMSLSLEECEQECLRDCNCTAYSSAPESVGEHGCLKWYGDLMDTRTFSDLGEDFYVRVDATDLAQYRKRSTLVKKAMVPTISVSAVVLLLLGSLMYCLLLKRKRDRRGRNHLLSVTTSSTYFEGLPGLKELDSEARRKTDIPVFDFGTVAAATSNFSSANELGQGGFGSVYKGVMNNGTEIAVKRLSKYSGQGNAEFKNEVRLIAKLQHRNLVKILGCCIQEDERLLIYEYLPNKSLDSLLFDETKRSILDWGKRFEIAYGVARGLMYLHQDSTLRIIHRDLKASNVLMDVALNPKISDFGMARICGGDQIEGNTKRVVGTYGYMAPEYAMQGRFSIKSDVYSYGVLLLEIITGQRNSGCYHMNPFGNLIGQLFGMGSSQVWELWKEGRRMDIVDTSMDKTYSEEMVSRCIQIGLLCVQRYASDRPTMSTLVFMLGNADVVLPSPKQPAFIDESASHGDIPGTCQGTCSVNRITTTVVEAR
ncbi:G-type lectin S-receptor-like serine/threonine-protein kinase RKS1 isoform X2 [Rhodamnia argentea]|uniref:Receptor-like serine/threonine-protein kinase n=1 Tax=Rhodamnia argentea TaxID=178133 RepID=A0ABM3HX06_9MYRT|nr:G-type lectin S-receptor-like serine/threonine-protein kinase RKS1 isoform X2 [Rhodamnia argentea]